MKFCLAFMGVMSLLSVNRAAAAEIDLDKVPEVAITSESHSFYLKGYAGLSMADINRLGRFDNDANAHDYRWKNRGDMDNAFLGGVGIGARLNDIVRLDGTIEYRAKNTVTGSDRNFSDRRQYEGDVQSTVLLANVYADLLTYHNVTPYVGTGIGASANHVSDFDVAADSVDYKASTKTKWDLAWALHAGIGVRLSPRIIFDIGYSYSDLGDAKTGNFSGTSSIKLDHLTSHDVKFGIRYAFK